MPLRALYVPHGPEEGAGRYMAPLPRRHVEDMGTYLSNLYIRQDVTDLQDFANILRSELDGAHYLNDGCHVQMLGRIDELSVQFNLLRAKHAHYVDEHWIPMQQFAWSLIRNGCPRRHKSREPFLLSSLWRRQCSSWTFGRTSTAPLPSRWSRLQRPLSLRHLPLPPPVLRLLTRPRSRILHFNLFGFPFTLLPIVVHRHLRRYAGLSYSVLS